MRKADARGERFEIVRLRLFCDAKVSFAGRAELIFLFCAAYLPAAVHQLMNQTMLGRPTRSISTAPQSGTIRNALCDITP